MMPNKNLVGGYMILFGFSNLVGRYMIIILCPGI